MKNVLNSEFIIQMQHFMDFENCSEYFTEELITSLEHK